MKGKNFLSSNDNYNISLEEIKRLNFFNFLDSLGAEFKKKKSSKYGRLYKYKNIHLWIRYDYKTGYYFYTSLDSNGDNGTLIDFIQNHIINERNLGKVRKYVKENLDKFWQ